MLSNNEVEQYIRPTTLGHKNSLFSKSYEVFKLTQCIVLWFKLQN
ncbi:IS66 family transposase [Ligilactobacillus equi]